MALSPMKDDEGEPIDRQSLPTMSLDPSIPSGPPSEDRSLAIGDRVGEYEVVGVLGSGGMGTVYLGRDAHLDRQVALKLIHDDKLANDEIRRRFVQEARAMARVRHPNVVAIHAYGELEDRPYFVMEYVPGQSLSMWSNKERTLAERIATLDQLCRGVEAIHASGAVHRDLKPGNVLIGEDGRVAVADFGLAQSFGSANFVPKVELIGTPSYMAPEVARAEAPSPSHAHSVDIYALGVLAYELLTGRLPFQKRGIPALLADHAYTMPPRPSGVCPDLPATFDGPLLCALAKDPRQRTPDAETLRRELMDALTRAQGDTAGPERILLADDDDVALMTTRELLESEFPNTEITCVTDAYSAMEVARVERPDVVVTDLNMPNGGGRELTAALRKHPDTSDVPIIVITGYGGATDWKALKELGADRFLVKPIDFESLLGMIRSVTGC